MHPIWVAALVLWIQTISAAESEARILKVLPHFLDKQGRIALSPGLFERDGYQRQLRENPSQVSGIRFDVQWSARGRAEDRLRLRVWVRGAKTDANHPVELEALVKDNRRLGGWSSVHLTGTPFQDCGQILSWRVVLMEGDLEIAEQRSFLW